MGICSSQTFTVGGQNLLGRCWDVIGPRQDIDPNLLESAWFPYEDTDNGPRPNYAFSLCPRIRLPTEKCGGAEGSSYLNKHNLAIHYGVEIQVRNSTFSETISSDDILRTTERGIGGEVSVAGTMISLGAEFSRVKSAGPGRSSSFIVIVVKAFELEIIPSQAKEREYTVREVDTDVEKKDVRDQYGEGIISSVLYGGFLVIETEQENFEAMKNGLMIRANVKGSVLGDGGGIGGNFARQTTEGAKSVNSSVRRIGGDAKMIPTSFTNASIEKLSAAVNKWQLDLLSHPEKAVPISLFFRTYKAIIRHVAHFKPNLLEDASREVDEKLKKEKGPNAAPPPFNNFFTPTAGSVPPLPVHTPVQQQTAHEHGVLRQQQPQHLTSLYSDPYEARSHSGLSSPPNPHTRTPAPRRDGTLTTAPGFESHSCEPSPWPSPSISMMDSSAVAHPSGLLLEGQSTTESPHKSHSGTHSSNGGLAMSRLDEPFLESSPLAIDSTLMGKEVFPKPSRHVAAPATVDVPLAPVSTTTTASIFERAESASAVDGNDFLLASEKDRSPLLRQSTLTATSASELVGQDDDGTAFWGTSSPVMPTATESTSCAKKADDGWGFDCRTSDAEPLARRHTLVPSAQHDSGVSSANNIESSVAAVVHMDSAPLPPQPAVEAVAASVSANAAETSKPALTGEEDVNNANRAPSVDDSEATWLLAKKENDAVTAELDDAHRVTAALQSKSDELQRHMRVLQQGFLPSHRVDAFDTVDFVEMFLRHPHELHPTEKVLTCADWLVCAAALLTHPDSCADRISIHADMDDTEAELLAGFIRSSSKASIPNHLRMLDISNNELTSTGAAAIINGVTECLSRREFERKPSFNQSANTPPTISASLEQRTPSFLSTPGSAGTLSSAKSTNNSSGSALSPQGLVVNLEGNFVGKQTKAGDSSVGVLQQALGRAAALSSSKGYQIHVE